jgi:hypothetical protein
MTRGIRWSIVFLSRTLNFYRSAGSTERATSKGGAWGDGRA